MSHSYKRVCGGPIACCSEKSVRDWKRRCNKDFRRKAKNVEYTLTNILKESKDPYDPRDGHHIYWNKRPNDPYWAEVYDKELRK